LTASHPLAATGSVATCTTALSVAKSTVASFTCGWHEQQQQQVVNELPKKNDHFVSLTSRLIKLCNDVASMRKINQPHKISSSPTYMGKTKIISQAYLCFQYPFDGCRTSSTRHPLQNITSYQ
jgi:Zn-dependent M32 family carboxypeptidase